MVTIMERFRGVAIANLEDEPDDSEGVQELVREHRRIANLEPQEICVNQLFAKSVDRPAPSRQAVTEPRDRAHR